MINTSTNPRREIFRAKREMQDRNDLTPARERELFLVEDRENIPVLQRAQERIVAA